MRRLTLLFAFLMFSAQVWATSTHINVVGSDGAIAISGFDVVSFHTEKKAVRGKPEFEHDFGSAKWRFSSKENLDLFKQSPEKFIPEWGGQCAWAVSENGGISRKKLSGAFEFIDGKLYLFANGNRSQNGPRDDFMYGRWSADNRIRDGNKHWPGLKKKLEDGTVVQPNASNYSRSQFD